MSVRIAAVPVAHAGGRGYYQTLVAPLYATLRMRVERAQANGVLPHIPPANLHYLVLGAAGLAFSQAAECRRVTGVDPTTDAFADAHAEAILRVFAPEVERRGRRTRRVANSSLTGSRKRA